jgi:hypothetical protein
MPPATTQVYLGKISDSEAIHWMDILHGNNISVYNQLKH